MPVMHVFVLGRSMYVQAMLVRRSNTRAVLISYEPRHTAGPWPVYDDRVYEARSISTHCLRKAACANLKNFRGFSLACNDRNIAWSVVVAACCRCCCGHCAGGYNGGWAHGCDRLGGIQRVPEASAKALLQVSSDPAPRSRPYGDQGHP